MEDNKVKNNKIINEYNIIRVIAVLLVVIGHCTYYRIMTNYGGIDFEPDIQNITIISKLLFKGFVFLNAVLYTFHMPLFFALSGALFKNSLENKKYKNFKELVVKKVKRLLIPFLIVTLFYAIPIKYISGYYNQSENVLKDILFGEILQQGTTHLWFLPTLFVIFCISYIYIQRSGLQSTKKLNKFILFILLVVANVLSPIVKIGFIRNLLFYTIYFCIGYFFETKRKKINGRIDNCKKRKFGYLITLIGILFIIVKIVDIKFIEDFIIIIIAILEVFVVYVIAYQLSKLDSINQNNKINKIGEYSFGIYLYSDPINYIILVIFGNKFSQYMNTEIGIIGLFFIRFFVTFYVSILITRLLKKAKIKYIC